MRVGLDLDGVLADFNNAYVARIRVDTGRDLFDRPPRMDTWHYAEAAGYTKREIRHVWDGINGDPAFWSTLKPYADVDDAVACLREMHGRGDAIYFITARPGEEATKRVTKDWLLRLLGFTPPVLMSGEKGRCCQALGLDDYIDDKWENAAEVGQTPTRSYLLTRPWNVHLCTPPNTTRVGTIHDFFSLLG